MPSQLYFLLDDSIFQKTDSKYGGEGGIWTHVTAQHRQDDFESPAFDHSATPPDKNTVCVNWCKNGGEEGIWTLGTGISRSLTFQASAFDHSATSPRESYQLSATNWRSAL